MTSQRVSKILIALSIGGVLIGLSRDAHALSRSGRGTEHHSHRPQIHARPQHRMRPQPRSHPRPHPSPRVRPRPRPHVRSQPRPHVRPQPRPRPRPHVRPQPRPRPRPHVRPQPRPRPRPHVRPHPRPIPRDHVHPRRPVYKPFRPRYWPQPHPHFHHHPWFGRIVVSIPPSHIDISIGGLLYYYQAGIYYRRHDMGYLVVPAPIGATITNLPIGYTSVDVKGRPYFYYYGTFYKHDPERNRYVIVSAPIGAVVPTIPAGHTTVYLHGVEHYVIGRTYFRPLYHDADLMYEVIPPPNRADVATLEIVPETIYAYPNVGQSPEQQTRDQEACHLWAVQQLGYDPKKPKDQSTRQGLLAYNRAFSACMQGRNYTVQ